MSEMDITNFNLKEIAGRVASGEIDEDVLMDSVKGVQFMSFIISYAEMHGFELGTIVFGATNVPVNISMGFLKSGDFEMAFEIIDSAIETLRTGKEEMMRRFNEQTPEGGVPPTK